MRYGDKVIWQYTHYLNSKSSVQRTKEGEFQGLIKHTCRYRGEQLACVLFKGNKRQSKVPLNSLRVE